MPYQKYSIADDAYGRLGSSLMTTSTTITLSSSQNLPPSKWIGTLVQYATDGSVAKKEKVLVSNNNMNVLTVTRGFDGNPAQTFNAGDYIFINPVSAVIIDMQDEISRLGSNPTGDMLKSTYDTDNSGVVDNAEKLGGQLPAVFEKVANKGVANGYASLDASGKLPTTQLPDLSINDVFTVASQSAMLALTAQTGDMAIRTDLSKTYVLSASPASTLANWKEIAIDLSGCAKLAGGNTFSGVQTFNSPVNGIFAPQGFLQNGKIVRTVTSNNLTVAIKTLAGGDPSASDPVYVRIGDTVRTLSSALSVTLNAGTNWFNAGSTELATKELDYFVSMGWKISTSSIIIGLARISHGQVYSDYSSTSTNERYIAVSSIPATTDEFEVVGRVNATLSGGAGYIWSIPATSIIINRPIYSTRWLYGGMSNVGLTTTPTMGLFKIEGDMVSMIVDCSGTSNSASWTFTLPITPTFVAPDVPHGLYQNNGSTSTTSGRSTIFGNQMTAHTDFNTGAWTASGGKYLRTQFHFCIR